MRADDGLTTSFRVLRRPIEAAANNGKIYGWSASDVPSSCEYTRSNR